MNGPNLICYFKKFKFSQSLKLSLRLHIIKYYILKNLDLMGYLKDFRFSQLDLPITKRIICMTLYF